MDTADLNWDINLRANLRLWPEVVDNVTALASLAGNVYDEDEFIKHFPAKSGKSPSDTRAVRNTFEIMAKAGLAYRDDASTLLELTELGKTTLSYLGVIDGNRYANEANLPLLGELFVRSYAAIPEWRAIWWLMRLTDNKLSNEELNRSMSEIRTMQDVPRVSKQVLESRDNNDPTLIGERIYKPGEFGTDKESDQRKAMNPQFLLAGAGGILIAVDRTHDMRFVRDWATTLFDDAIAMPWRPLALSTQAEFANRLSSLSESPIDLRS